ncbi:MAG: hypothetical protein WBW93_07885, partial [Steroidobacteraceae bacterium]
MSVSFGSIRGILGELPQEKAHKHGHVRRIEPVSPISETPKSPDSNRLCKLGGFRFEREADGMQTKHRRREGQ